MIALALLVVAHAPALAPFVYVRDGHLYHSTLGRIPGTRGVREPALSPDGTKALYWRSGEISPVIEITLKTRKQRQVGGTNARSPFYGPDGKTIYFTQSLPWELYSVATTGGKAKKVFGVAQGAKDAFQPSWSWGNPTLIVQDMNNAYWLDGTGEVKLKKPLVEILGDDSGLSSSTRIVDRPGHPSELVYCVDVPREQGQPADWEMGSALYTYDLTRRVRRRLTPVGLFATDPRWTRDGERILFRGVARYGKDAVYAINSDGTGLKKLTAGEEPGV